MPWAALWAGYYPRRLGRRELMRDRPERGGCDVKNVDPGRKIDAERAMGGRETCEINLWLPLPLIHCIYCIICAHAQHGFN